MRIQYAIIPAIEDRMNSISQLCPYGTGNATCYRMRCMPSHAPLLHYQVVHKEAHKELHKEVHLTA
jgi:hypothetical protein